MFCEKCRYLYNITKDVKNKQLGGKTQDALTRLFNKISDEPIVKKDLKRIKGRDIIDDDRFEALSKKDQKKLMTSIKAIDKNFFEEDIDSEENHQTNEAFFICKFCKNHKLIKPGTIIYSKKYSTGVVSGSSINETADYTYAIYDQTLARTHNYVCRNPECETHQDNKLAEAVLTKNNLEQIVYICTICATSWTSQ